MKGRNKIKEPTVGAVGVNSGSAQMHTAVMGLDMAAVWRSFCTQKTWWHMTEKRQNKALERTFTSGTDPPGHSVEKTPLNHYREVTFQVA